MKRIPLKSKEVSKLLAPFKISLSKKDHIERVEDTNKLILVNKEPLFFYYNEQLLPTLKLLQKNLILKQVTVDMGAIKFVANGADIMRPGITKIDPTISQDEAIVIVDETHNKPLAVGIALLSGEDMQAATNGKVVKNIHFVGDEIWQFSL